VYRIEVAARARRELSRLPDHEHSGITAAMRRLADDPRPRGSFNLKGPVYRLRVGACRITYAVSDAQSVVVVLKIAKPEATPGSIEELLWRPPAILPLGESAATHQPSHGRTNAHNYREIQDSGR